MDKPRPCIYIPTANGKLRPLGISTLRVTGNAIFARVGEAAGRLCSRGRVMKRRQFSASKPKSKWLISSCLLGVAIATSSFLATSSFAAQSCASLADLKINDTNLLSAVEVPASGDLPAFCRVLGYVRRRVDEDVATLIPHSPGCADFPLPVLHGRASLAVV